jgi:hypothetical protein
VLCRAQAGAGADAAPSRRAALAGAAAALLVAAAPAALADAGAAAASPAAAQALTRYVDDEGFAISIPGDWGSGEGVLSGNSSFSGGRLACGVWDHGPGGQSGRLEGG